MHVFMRRRFKAHTVNILYILEERVISGSCSIIVEFFWYHVSTFTGIFTYSFFHSWLSFALFILSCLLYFFL